MNARGMENSVTLLEFQRTLIGQMEIAFDSIRFTHFFLSMYKHNFIYRRIKLYIYLCVSHGGNHRLPEGNGRCKVIHRCWFFG